MKKANNTNNNAKNSQNKQQNKTQGCGSKNAKDCN